jgi:signal transduction histidine kinase
MGAATLTGPRSKRLRAGLSLRLFAAMGLVVAAGAGTLLVVALLVAPQVFHAHLRMALGPIPPATQQHVDEAFGNAILLSLPVAVAVSLIVALGVTWLVSRRIAVPVTDLAAAAQQLAAGDYETRVPEPGLGPEFAALATSFNSMARQLAATERVRQRLLADLAHELRTPLASIEASLEAVADGILPADAGTWAILTEQTRRINRLVDDIAAISNAEERTLHLEPEPHAPAALAASAAASVQARYTAKDVALILRLDADTPMVRCDPQRIAEALANLLDNALRHTPPRGRVTISTGTTREFGRPSARITIADTGDGFDPDQADRLFERFYRTDTARTHRDAGSGIGLTITRAIINAHHGTVHAHSSGPGHGAVFTITLPASTT